MNETFIIPVHMLSLKTVVLWAE